MTPAAPPVSLKWRRVTGELAWYVEVGEIRAEVWRFAARRWRWSIRRDDHFLDGGMTATEDDCRRKVAEWLKANL